MDVYRVDLTASYGPPAGEEAEPIELENVFRVAVAKGAEQAIEVGKSLLPRMVAWDEENAVKVHLRDVFVSSVQHVCTLDA